MPKKRKIAAEDLYKLELISALDISPDGENIIYSQQRIEQGTEKKFSNLWLVPFRGKSPRQFTYGNQVDRLPKWSPDGKQIAFLSNRDNPKQFQIYLIPFHGGEARPLTNFEGEIWTFDWSPDGKQFIVQFRKKDDEATAREKDEASKQLGIVERRVENVFYKFDGYGFFPKEKFHIWVVNARTGKSTQLTDSSGLDEQFPAWSPDGQTIAFISNRNPDPGLEYDDYDLFTIPAAGGEFTKIGTPGGTKHSISFSPDGRWIAFVGSGHRSDWWRNNKVWIVPFDGSGNAIDLTGKFDIHASHWTINDQNIGAAGPYPLVWSPDSQRIYFNASQHGKTYIHSIDFEGKNLHAVIDGNGTAGIHKISKDGSRIAYFYGTMTDPGQVWSKELPEKKPKRVTNLNRRLFNALDLGEIEEVWIKGKDNNDLQGWILKPPGFNKDTKYPSILEIHGGPLAQYGHFFMHEFYFLAAQGYVVHFSNPRGGQGYGEEHAKAIWGGWGEKDYSDLMLWTDFISQKPYIDSTNMGVTGGSYGGYISLWIIGHTERFRAAVAQRVVSNLISMWGSSDLNWVFQEVLNDKPPWDDVDKLWNHSPMKFIGNAQTPTMLIHSEQDHRCPIEQGEQAFVALKKLGVDTEMIRYPDEPHGLSRTGRTDRRISRLNHIVRWFEKYLK